MGKQELIPAGDISAAEQTRLDEIAAEIRDLESKSEDALVQVKLREAELLNEAWHIHGDDNVSFRAWVDCPESGLPFKNQRAFEFIHLHNFCKNKTSLGGIRFSHLLEVSRPKYNDTPEKRKITSAIYKKLKRQDAQNASGTMTISELKQLLKDEIEGAGEDLPMKALAKKMTVVDMEDRLIRLLNDCRNAFKGAERQQLKQFILAELGDW